MTPPEFADLLARFAQRPILPTSERHLYVWTGEAAALSALMPSDLGVELDLCALCASLPRRPNATSEARRLLREAIRAWLGRNALPPNRQRAIVVRSNSLLARYQVPLDAFYQASSESCLVVFIVSSQETSFSPAHPLPPYVSFQPGMTLAYLRSSLGDAAVIGEAKR